MPVKKGLQIYMESIFTIQEAAMAVSGEMRNCDSCKDVVFGSVSTDTRTIKEGALFVALRGEKFDGHKYIKVAAESGAICSIVKRGAEIPDELPVILVESTGQALLDLAGAYRKKFNIPVVAVTGSVGKTSTRGMITSVLSQKYKVLSTEGNLNNEIGVPHTLFGLSGEHQIAVIEMGMNHFGEISRITAAAQPNTAVITNVGEAHIENLGSREGILKAKLEVLEGLSYGGTVILNGDNDMLWSVNGTLEFETLYCGAENAKCDLIAENIKTYAEGSEFTFRVDGREYCAEISVPGVHHVYNALVSILVGLTYDVPMEKILDGVRNFVPVGMRQAAVAIDKYIVIKDCYNANPTSMKSGLEVLSLRKDGGRKVACLGDMLELGMISDKAHKSMGKCVLDYKVDCLITVGERARLIAEGAVESGMNKKNVYSFDNNEGLCQHIYDILKDGDVVLLKASRSMHLEEIAEYLEKNSSKR